MSSDDDAEELASLRAQRAARLGQAAGLTSLQEKQRREEQQRAAASQYYVDGKDRGPRPSDVETSRDEQAHAAAAGRPTAPADDEEDDADEDGPVVVGFEEEPELMDDALRSQFPMSFGLQEQQAVRAEEVHSTHKRTTASFGPPRPPAKPTSAVQPPQGASSFGPPRPPAAGFGPPRPPAKTVTIVAPQLNPDLVGPLRPPDDEGEQDLVGPPRPPPDGEDDDGMVGPPRPADDAEEDAEAGPSAGAVQRAQQGAGPGSEDADEEYGPGGGGMSGDYDDDEGDDPWHLPVTHEVTLGGHNKAVVALDVDASGARIITGSLDYTLRMYDFNGMKSDMKAFRELEPQEGHPVYSVSWSPSGEAFMVATGSSKAKLFDRDGKTLGEFVRGDMYIRDLKNTKGHISGLTAGQWHPTDRYTAMTSSEDGTLRVWDCENILQKTVIKPTLSKPVRTSVTTCRYNHDGRLIGAGLMDGTIQIWSVSGKFGTSAAVGQVLPPKQQMVEKQAWSYVSRPSQLIKNGHEPGSDITGLAFSKDGNTLLSRGMDSTLKIWDLRKFTQPVHVFGGLPCAYANTQCIFSPDEQLVLTGVSAGSQDDAGALVFLDKARMQVVRKVGMPGNVTAMAWHPRLNQIFVGIGNRKTGSTRALYDTTFSERGVMIGAVRKPRQPNPFDFQPPLLIREFDPNRKRRRDRAETDPSKARRPDPGKLAGHGREGRIGTCAKTLLTQHILKTKGKLNAVDEMQDPREALLRHADKKDEFSLFTAAYKATQPKPIYAQEEEEEEEGK